MNSRECQDNSLFTLTRKFPLHIVPRLKSVLFMLYAHGIKSISDKEN